MALLTLTLSAHCLAGGVGGASIPLTLCMSIVVHTSEEGPGV